MFKTKSNANPLIHLGFAVALCSTLPTVAPLALAGDQEGPILYSEVENNVDVDGAISAFNGVDGNARNYVAVIAGKVRTHAKVTNNIKVDGAISSFNGVDGTAENYVGVITDKSVGGSSSGGGGLLGTIGGFLTNLF